MRFNKRRWTVLLLSTVILLGVVAACGGASESTTTPTEVSTVQATATEVPPTATPVAPTATPLPPTPTPVPTDTPVAEETPEDDSAATGDLPNVPLPEDAEGVSYEFDEISFTSPSDVATLVEFYRAALADEGWQELSDFSLVEEDFAYVEFEQEDESLSLTVFGGGEGSDAAIDLSSAPSLTGAMDGDSVAMTVADWPTPPDATEIDISGETLSFKTALLLADVAEFYRPVYESKGLDASCLEDVGDYTSISCSYSNGDMTVSFFAFEGFNDTEVEIEVINYGLESSDDSGELGVTEEDGLPLPDDHTGYSSEGGEFRRMIALSSPSDVATLVTFFETELANRGWTLDDSEETATETTLRFSGSDGELVVTLTPGDETEAVLVQRNQAAAEESGVLPPAGQARLYLANFTEGELTVTIDGQTIDVPPSAGMESPSDAPTVDLPPGTYDVTTTVGGNSVTDEIVVGADESWALLLDELGALPVQIY